MCWSEGATPLRSALRRASGIRGVRTRHCGVDGSQRPLRRHRRAPVRQRDERTPMAEQPAAPSPRSSAEEAFAELGRIPLAEASLQTVLGKVADLARELLPGLPAVSITLLADDEAETAVATDGLARELDESQYARGYGPCLEAAAGGELVEITDAREEQRWPAYTAQLVTHGVFATLSVPLPV